MITRPIEWIKQNGGVENFSPDHVLIVLPDELDILFCHDLENCCYGPEKDDSYDVWCDSRLDLMHDDIHEKRPFRMKKQVLEISEVYRGGSDFCIGAVKAIDSEKPIIAWYKENCIYSDDRIGIEEDTVLDYLFPFLNPHFDGTIKENANRINYPDGTWDWHGDNFFTFEQMRKIISEIRDAIKFLNDDFDNPALDKYRKSFANISSRDKEWKYGMSDDEKNKIAKRHKDDLIDFYERFISYMERFMRNGEKVGLNLIVFTGS